MLNIGEEYKQRMFEKGFYYDEDTKVYYNEHGVYLWSVLIDPIKKEPYFEIVLKEDMEKLGISPIELQGKDVSMFQENYNQLKIKHKMGNELVFRKENNTNYSIYSVYSKNYFDVLTKQKTLIK